MKIVFDYRFDTNGFFNDPQRRAALEAAEAIWGNLLQDDFDPIPAGIEFTVTNPQTNLIETVVLDQEIEVAADFTILREGMTTNGGLFTDINFSPGNRIRVFHDVELASESIVVSNSPPDLAI